jgi:hypothetical protein
MILENVLCRLFIIRRLSIILFRRLSISHL